MPQPISTQFVLFFRKKEPHHHFWYKLKLIQPSQPVWIPPTDPVVFRCILEVHVVKSYGTCLDLDRWWWCLCGTFANWKKHMLALGMGTSQALRRDLFDYQLQKINIEPEKWWFGRWFSSSRGVFSGSMLIFQGVSAAEDGIFFLHGLFCNVRWQTCWCYDLLGHSNIEALKKSISSNI